MFIIDAMSQEPVYEQLVNQTERYILLGALNGGDAMPSVRRMSVTLPVNPNTIQKAYTELDRRGVIISVPGKGCFIAENAKEIIAISGRKRLSQLQKLLEELKLAGVAKSDVQNIVSTVYDKEEQYDNGK